VIFYFSMHLLSVELSLAASSNSINRVLNFVNLSLCVFVWNLMVLILLSPVRQ
jgi:hypothetical protein